MDPTATSRQVEKLPLRLSHYTTQAGLMGIIAGSRLRASLAELMNDRDETVRAEAIAREEIVASSSDGFEAMRGFLRDDVDDDYFVTSFTEVEDGASMWQHYGQEGYSIVFDTAGLEASTGEDLIQVSYQEEEFRRIVRQDMQRYLAHEESTRPAGPRAGARKAGFKEAEWR